MRVILRVMNPFKIVSLRGHPEAIPILGDIWQEVLGKIWMPELGIEEIQSLYYEEPSCDLPCTQMALCGETPVGSCTLQLNDGIRPDLEPWLANLVIAGPYQKQGIGKMLINATIKKAKQLHFKKLYLFTFDPNLIHYYEQLGWNKIGTDEFKSYPVTVMEYVVARIECE